MLDNCEHVIDEARTVATAILHACPNVRVLATSREALRVAGEEIYRMPSLELAGAVRLFSDRGLSVDKRFTLTDANVPHVEEICRRLDGIPLAIELAAARVNVLPPAQLVKRLDERFRVLTGGDRSALPRHQTMRALIDWSYDLLAYEERRVFRSLSVFAGGCTLQSAAIVCGEDEIALLDRLSSLVDKSLVLAEPENAGMRYRLLESTMCSTRANGLSSTARRRPLHAHMPARIWRWQKSSIDVGKPRRIPSGMRSWNPSSKTGALR